MSKFDIAASAGKLDFSFEEDAWREQSRLQAAVLEAYEAREYHSETGGPINTEWYIVYNKLTLAVNAAYRALQEHIEAGQ